MEAAGLVVGVAGLAGIFTACVDCYRLVRRGASFDMDYKILETKFNNQEFRLLSWGKACGLVGGTQYESGLDDPALRARVRDTLECISGLFENEKKLSSRFGLRLVQDRPGALVHALPLLPGTASAGLVTGVVGRPHGRRSWRLFSSRGAKPVNQAGKVRSFRDTAVWVISDRDKFVELVQNLTDFNNDLDAMTRPLREVAVRQRVYVEQEVEVIQDVQVLEEMAVASEHDGDVISDVVSVRLASIRSGTINTGTDSHNTTSYRTALAEIPATIDEVPEEPEFPARPDGKPLLESYKLVCTGDYDSGIIRLLIRFARGELPELYIPAVFENWVADLNIDGMETTLELWHTAGQETYERLRPLTYPDTHVVMICFRANNPTRTTRANIVKRWGSEVRKYCPRAPIILVGLNTPKEDESNDNATVEGEPGDADDEEDRFDPLSITQDLGAPRYFFCDPATGFGVSELFDYATRAAIAFADAEGQKPRNQGGVVGRLRRLVG